MGPQGCRGDLDHRSPIRPIRPQVPLSYSHRSPVAGERLKTRRHWFASVLHRRKPSAVEVAEVKVFAAVSWFTPRAIDVR